MSNEVLLLYLNPELVVNNNITSIEEAQIYAQSNTSLWSTLDPIPPVFDANVFISDHKNNINVSGINALIKQASLIDGESLNDIENGGVYIPTIYRNAYLHPSSSSNNYTFKFNLPGDQSQFTITSSNLNSNDHLKIIKNNVETFFVQVTSIVDSETFVVDGGFYQFLDTSADYLVIGIKVYDPLRLARINYLRLFALQQSIPNNNVNVDPDFNYELYQVLYPDTRLLDRQSAYVDYINRRNNEDIRIAKTRDIQSSCNVMTLPFDFNSLRVNHLVHLDFTQPTGRVQWGDVNLFYCTSNDFRSAASIPPFFDGLITERAIKTYIDRSFTTVATFSNIIVNGTAEFTNNVSFARGKIDQAHIVSCTIQSATLCNEFTSKGQFYFDSNVTFNKGGTTIFNNNVVFTSNAVLSSYTPFNVNDIAASNIRVSTSLSTQGQVEHTGNVIHSGSATYCNYALFLNTAEFLGSAIFSCPITTNHIVNHNHLVNMNHIVRVSSNILINDGSASNMFMHQATVCNLNIIDTLRANQLDALHSSIQNLNVNQASVSNLIMDVFTTEDFHAKTCTFKTSVSSNVDTRTLVASNLNTDWLYANVAQFKLQQTIGNAEFNSNVHVECNLFVGNDLEVGQCIYGPSFGISDMISLDPNIIAHNSSNVSVNNLHVNESVSVNNFMSIGTQYTTSNTVLEVNGIIEATNYDVTSDKRLKENIKPLNGEDVLEKLEQIQPVMFNYKHKHNQNMRCGFIAQNVEHAFPEVVTNIEAYQVKMMKHAYNIVHSTYVLYNHKFEPGDKLLVRSCKNENIILTVKRVHDRNTFSLEEPYQKSFIFILCIIYDKVKGIDYQQLCGLMCASIIALKKRLRMTLGVAPPNNAQPMDDVTF